VQCELKAAPWLTMGHHSTEKWHHSDQEPEDGGGWCHRRTCEPQEGLSPVLGSLGCGKVLTANLVLGSLIWPMQVQREEK
jgi:hypothetical protein